jgi:hypothetical protein
MAQQKINYGTAPDGSGGDSRRAALEKLEANDAELYGGLAVTQSLAGAGGMRNFLLNADGRINQRVFAGGALAANRYSYDRWRALGAGCSVTFGASTISWTGTLCQAIETPNLANAVITISVSNPTAPIVVSLQPDATTITGASGTIPAGGGIQSVKLTVPATMTGHVFVLLTAAAGVSVDGAGRRAGIQVELGSVATGFDIRHVAVELAMCMRYYNKSYVLTSAPGAIDPINVMQFIAVNTGAYFKLSYMYPVRMRAIPAITIYSPVTGASGMGRNYSTNADVAMINSSNGDARLAVAVASPANNSEYGFHYTADAEL